MRRTFVLINNTGLGGTERRFGRLFAKMADEDPHACLIINAGLCRALLEAGLVTGHEGRIWKLPEPMRALARLLRLGDGALGFWMRKLDYLLFACLLFAQYVLTPCRTFHLVLGGVYVSLPLMLVRSDHRYVISVVSANLAMLVGPVWATSVYRFALRRCIVIDALSERTQADLVLRGLPREKIMVSPCSVIDLHKFQPAPEKEPWVIFAGRLVEEKNPLLFLEAVPVILQSVPTAKFFLLGEGPLRSKVEQALDRLGLRDDIVQSRFCPAPSQILAKARVFVSLQRTDNYPSQSLLEAMACGMASVATDVGLTWRLVNDETGIRVKPDHEQIAEAVTGLLKDPHHCEQMGLAARRLVIREHSGERYRAYLEELYTAANRTGPR